MEIIKLNLIPSGVNPVCHCSQYDTERVIRAELFDGLTPYSLASGDEITLNVRKPDNTVVTADVPVTEGNNYVDLTTTEQICACTGENLCDLTLTNGNKKIGTLNFIMIIERDVLADGIESQSVIKDLDERVIEAVGDNYYTKDETEELIDNELKDVYPLGEASGAIASFNTGVIMPLKSCICEINPYHVDTPSVSNPSAVSGYTGINVTRCGKNLCNWKVNTTSYPLTISLPKGTYTISSDGQSTFGFWYFRFTDINGNVISDNPSQFGLSDYNYSSGSQYFYGGNNRTDVTFILPDNDYTVRIGTLNGNGTVSAMLVQGSTATTYEAYKGEIYNIDWSSVAGIVLGGYINVTTGELVVNHGKYTFTGEEAWTKQQNLAKYYSNAWILRGIAILPPNNTQSVPIYTDIGDFDIAYDNLQNYSNSISVARDGRIGITEDLHQETNTLKDVSIVYELVTPLTYQLDPVQIKTLLNLNSLYHDCNGDIDVVYHHALTAKNIYFDNTGTALQADNVEDAIKEILTLIQGGNNSRALNLSKGSLKVEAPVSNEEPAIEEDPKTEEETATEEPVKAEELTTEEESEEISDSESESTSDEER